VTSTSGEPFFFFAPLLQTRLQISKLQNKERKEKKNSPKSIIAFFHRKRQKGPWGRASAVKRETTVSEHARRGLRAVWYSQIGYSKTQTTSYSYRVGW
jgi:hypothetical protein